ncbi:MAG: flagellar hook-associated protein FlgK [Deltaproteobacteria bacterium]|nr:flagellar hook-associated protein FlgK [Deltaproteobacteria bacterium]
MTGIYGVILNSGRGALLAQQKAIEITGHNIANVNTPGYSRQRVNLAANDPLYSGIGLMGGGVRATEIQRIYDRFLGLQINNENQNLGRWEARKGALERVEIIFDESSGYGLNQAMSEFWNAWQDLANNPSGHVERVTLLAKSETMATTFNNMYSNLEQVQKDIDTSIRGTVEEINLIAQQVADLNQKIVEVEVNGQNANDYRDSRDLLLRELSSMIDINTFENNDGSVTVSVGSGKPLVESIFAWSLSTETNASGLQDIVWVDSDGNTTDITNDISGGKLKGWIEARDVAIPDYLDRLDDLAANIISEVNALHSNGFGLDGSTGNDVFTGTSASDMAVNQLIADDVNLIAAAGSAGGVPGDNSNAIAIANLQNDLLMGGNTATFDDYFNSIVSDVGSGVQNATVNFNHQYSMVEHLDNYRESISGVSLDEEMVNLVKYQHAYNAAAKLISLVDELLNTVISMV